MIFDTSLYLVFLSDI